MANKTAQLTLASLARKVEKLERLLLAHLARLSFLEERAILADRADIGGYKKFKNRSR